MSFKPMMQAAGAGMICQQCMVRADSQLLAICPK